MTEFFARALQSIAQREADRILRTYPIIAEEYPTIIEVLAELPKSIAMAHLAVMKLDTLLAEVAGVVESNEVIITHLNEISQLREEAERLRQEIPVHENNALGIATTFETTEKRLQTEQRTYKRQYEELTAQLDELQRPVSRFDANSIPDSEQDQLMSQIIDQLAGITQLLNNTLQDIKLLGERFPVVKAAHDKEKAEAENKSNRLHLLEITIADKADELEEARNTLALPAVKELLEMVVTDWNTADFKISNTLRTELLDLLAQQEERNSDESIESIEAQFFMTAMREALKYMPDSYVETPHLIGEDEIFDYEPDELDSQDTDEEEVEDNETEDIDNYDDDGEIDDREHGSTDAGLSDIVKSFGEPNIENIDIILNQIMGRKVLSADEIAELYEKIKQMRSGENAKHPRVQYVEGLIRPDGNAMSSSDVGNTISFVRKKAKEFGVLAPWLFYNRPDKERLPRPDFFFVLSVMTVEQLYRIMVGSKTSKTFSHIFNSSNLIKIATYTIAEFGIDFRDQDKEIDMQLQREVVRIVTEEVMAYPESKFAARGVNIHAMSFHEAIEYVRQQVIANRNSENREVQDLPKTGSDTQVLDLRDIRTAAPAHPLSSQQREEEESFVSADATEHTTWVEITDTYFKNWLAIKKNYIDVSFDALTDKQQVDLYTLAYGDQFDNELFIKSTRNGKRDTQAVEEVGLDLSAKLPKSLTADIEVVKAALGWSVNDLINKKGRIFVSARSTFSGSKAELWISRAAGNARKPFNDMGLSESFPVSDSSEDITVKTVVLFNIFVFAFDGNRHYETKFFRMAEEYLEKIDLTQYFG
jgi:hypothetical protein